VKGLLKLKDNLYRKSILQILKSLIVQCKLSTARHLNTPPHLQLDKVHNLRSTMDDQLLLSRILYPRSEAAAGSAASEVRRSSRT
jgi:hypothetical protein